MGQRSQAQHRDAAVGFEYKVAFNLYSQDGKREVEVLELRDGQAYLIERDWVEGTTFKARHAGSPV